MDNQMIVSSGLFSQPSTNQDFGIEVAAPFGNLFWQLLFGWLADVVGRKRMCMGWFIFCTFQGSNLATITDGIELRIIIAATLVQALAGSGPAVNIIVL